MEDITTLLLSAGVGLLIGLVAMLGWLASRVAKLEVNVKYMDGALLDLFKFVHSKEKYEEIE